MRLITITNRHRLTALYAQHIHSMRFLHQGYKVFSTGKVGVGRGLVIPCAGYLQACAVEDMEVFI